MKKYFMPVGNTDFGEIRKSGLYYIDKTMLIDQLVDKNKAKVTLFTRPRRFGKTLNMSMLEHFFDIRKDSRAIFEGLEISENTTLCSEWMNQYPTIFISFKEVVGINFEIAFDRLKALIKELFRSHRYLLEKIQDGDEKAEFKATPHISRKILKVKKNTRQISRV